ncbi:MAG: hypothetical protein ABJG14_12035 [Sulfitobacter sp.]
MSVRSMLVLLFDARLPFVAASSLCAVLRFAFVLCPLRFCFSKSTLAKHPQHEEKNFDLSEILLRQFSNHTIMP